MPEESFRIALCIKDGFLGELEVKGLFGSLFRSSLSLGENEAPKGLSSCFAAGGLGLGGVLTFSLTVLCAGGVLPVENLELMDEIHELRLPGIVLGALPLTGVFGGFFDFGSDGFSGAVVPFASRDWSP